MRLTKCLMVSVLLVVSLFGASVFGQQQYTLKIIPDLGGSQGLAFAVTNAGTVVGTMATADSSYHAFKWRESTSTQDLGIFGGSMSSALGANDIGQVTGVYLNGGTGRGFVSTNQIAWQDIGHLSDLNFTTAYGVNMASEVVGYSEVHNPLNPANILNHAFQWNGAGMRDLGTLAGPEGNSYALAINNQGCVVGYSTIFPVSNSPEHAFIYCDYTMHDLGSPFGDLFDSRAYTINDDNEVGGDYWNPVTNSNQACKWRVDGTHVGLGAIENNGYSAVYGLNNHSEAVGWSSFGNTDGHAFVWHPDGAGMKDLNDLVVNMPVGWYLMKAYGNNDNGWIVGEAQNATNPALSFAFLLIPIVPPCRADFNNDGDTDTDADIEAFFACLAGNCCGVCGTSDFNGDGEFGTDADIESFFRVLAGGPC